MDDRLKQWVDWHKGQISSFYTKDLAEYLGISTRTIQRWMGERTRPNEEQLQKISQYVKENT
jgi:transcriptional regulator with XRE-family HTH domain